MVAIPALAIPGARVTREERFSGLVNRQSRFVYQVVYAVLRNSHDAEDAVQETFLKLYRSNAWEEIRDERAFLARTAWRVAIDRRPKRQTVESGANMPSGAASPEDAAIRADWNGTIHRLVDALPEELRQPLALSTVEEMNSREIGEVMGIPEGTVRGRLMRARQILKEKLEVLMEGRHEKR
jgi:RNA polymerase sigma-70 factor, ECF subfamily